MPITNGYATLVDVKAELRLTTTTDDTRLERCVETASRFIDLLAGRVFYAPGVTVSEVAGTGTDTIFVRDSANVTLVQESLTGLSTYVTVPATGWYTPFVDDRPITRIIRSLGAVWARGGRVRVTSNLQWSGATPKPIETATLIEAVRLFKRPDSPEGVLAGDFGAARLARVDPDVLALVRPYKRRVLG